MSRIFLLSPASCTGLRAQALMRDGAGFDLALRVRAGAGATHGEVFSYMSALYFRGKLAYAKAFARPPVGIPGVLVITPSDGLRRPEDPLDHVTLARYARVAIDKDDPRYCQPLARDARRLARIAVETSEVVLLGSIATGKYVDVLRDVFGNQLRFPAAFVGRGDMSRGGLLLRCVREGRELGYVGLDGTVRHGRRPPRLAVEPVLPS